MSKSFRTREYQSGQMMPVSMGLMAVAAVSLFLVFNSHRAVDEKINLVNAADATAYSGAQMAARELNFMALTNRAMIANEVAIGHMMAYQTEVDLVVNALTTGMGGLIGTIINAILGGIGAPAMDVAQQTSQVLSGAYILAVNATNELYSGYQKDEYRSLVAMGRDSIIDAAMLQVASQYQINPNITISVNSPEQLLILAESTDVRSQAIVKDVKKNARIFCSAIIFAKPGQTSATNIYSNNEEENTKHEKLSSQCDQYYESVDSGEEPPVEPSEFGSVDNPESDGGVMLTLLRNSANAAPSSSWVMDRNVDDYSLTGRSVRRRGNSDVAWDTTNNQINWKTVGDDTLKTRFWSLILTINAKASGDAKALADKAATTLGSAFQFLQDAELCGEIDCAQLAASTYTGIQQYAMLNPLMGDDSGKFTITSLITQSARCNDDLGIDENGNPVEHWHTDQTRYGLNNCSGENISAVAKAEVFYQRPVCTGSTCTADLGFDPVGVSNETRNLFNPFWQARLLPY